MKRSINDLRAWMQSTETVSSHIPDDEFKEPLKAAQSVRVVIRGDKAHLTPEVRGYSALPRDSELPGNGRFEKSNRPDFHL